MRKLAFALVLLVPLGGCALYTSIMGGSTQQILFSLHGDYNNLLAGAVTYKKLPRCSDTQKAPCSQQAIVDKMAQADDVAFPLVQKADSLAQDPNTPENALQAIKSELTNALSAFRLIFTTNNISVPAGA